MARPLRMEYEDAFYHVMNRGRGRQRVFPNPSYYESFLLCLKEAHKRFGIEIHTYCLLGNHYHLLIKTPRGNLSRAMRHIDGIYTQRHNRLKHTDGPLFRGRYKAIVIDASSYLLQVSRYIHRNPIELKRPLVDTLDDYPWSSYSAFLNQEKVPTWLNRDAVYAELASSQRYAAYRAFVEQGNDPEVKRFYQLKNMPCILGDKGFKTYAHQQAQSLDDEIDKKGLKELVDLSVIANRVADHFGLNVRDIYTTKKGRGAKNIPRWMAMKLCQELGGAKLSELAKVFNVVHYSTVSQTIGRLNRLLLEDKQVSLEFYKLSQDLTP